MSTKQATQRVTVTRKNSLGVSYIRYGTPSSFESLGSIVKVGEVWIGKCFTTEREVKSTYRAQVVRRIVASSGI